MGIINVQKRKMSYQLFIKINFNLSKTLGNF